MKESSVRESVNRYSRQTSGHPFEDYGNKIKVVVNDDSTIYECIVRTQYEDRSPEEKRRPYKGWEVAPRKYFSLRDVSSWAFNLQTPSAFTDKKTFIEVKGSAHVEECGGCSGKGRSTCPTCHGNAREKCPVCGGNYDHLSCPTCGGKAWVECPSCHGSGRITCSHCNGTGSITETVSVWKTHWDNNLQRYIGGYEYVKETRNCLNCIGGHLECRTCHDSRMFGKRGYIRCRTCGNRGYVTCNNCTQGYMVCKTCSGGGQLVCSTCQGEGNNEYRYIVNRTLEHSTLRSHVCDKRLQSFAEGRALDYPTVDFDVRKASLDQGLYPENARCSAALGKLVAEAEPESGKILFQEAIVRHVEATWVEYQYDGVTYSGVICGGVFYPDGSPIDDWSSELVGKAEKKMKRGSSAATLKMLDQAQQAGADIGEIRSLRNKAYDKIDRIHAAGVSTAFWLAVVVIAPLVFNFYDKINPVAPWAIVTNNPKWGFFGMVPLSQTLIYLAVLLCIRAAFVGVSDGSHIKRHGSVWIYFAKGFGLFLLSAIGAFAGLAILNYLGLSIVTTIALGLVILAVVLAVSLVVLIIKWIAGIFV